jgi:hypothetical protein
MTVKELAKICNVHYNTMRKWLSDNKVKKTNNTRNAQFLLTDDVISKAKKHFLKTDEIKDEKIDNILIQQLTQKDIQIVKQQEQIDHLQKLLENQQVLTLKAQERVQLLETQKEEQETEITEQPQKKKWQFWK